MAQRSRWRTKQPTEADRARAKDYNSAEYKRTARALAVLVESGNGFCWRCRGWINPEPRDRYGRRLWHVGHDDNDRTIIRGPEHGRCNTSSAARKGNAMQRGRAPTSSSSPLRW